MKKFFIGTFFFLLCVGIIVLYNSSTEQSIQFTDDAVNEVSLVCQEHGHECAIPLEVKIKVKSKCKTCNGTRQMSIKKTHAACLGKGCKVCDYKGYFETKVECAACKGTGWIEKNK